MISPVVLFVYNRPEHTRKTLDALSKNEIAHKTKVFVFSDGARNIEELPLVNSVRDIILDPKYSNLFSEIECVFSEENKGLATSVIAGVTKVINKYGKVIVLEDDLVTSQDFLTYMNDCLYFFENDPNVGSISGYSPLDRLPESYCDDVYKVQRTSSHGWATWKNIWSNVDWEGKTYQQFIEIKENVLKFNSNGEDRIWRLRRVMNGQSDTWSVVFGFDQFINGYFTIYPRVSRLNNIGNDGSGANVKSGDQYNKKFVLTKSNYKLNKIEFNEEISNMFYRHFSGGPIRSKIRQLKRNMYGIFGFLRK